MEKALELAPKSSEALLTLVSFYISERKVEEATKT
jgi:hypothetical protein